MTLEKFSVDFMNTLNVSGRCAQLWYLRRWKNRDYTTCPLDYIANLAIWVFCGNIGWILQKLTVCNRNFWSCFELLLIEAKFAIAFRAVSLKFRRTQIVKTKQWSMKAIARGFYTPYDFNTILWYHEAFFFSHLSIVSVVWGFRSIPWNSRIFWRQII